MNDVDSPQFGQRYMMLGMSTLAFTVCFAVWTIFSIISIRPNLGLTETEFGILVATPVLTGFLSRIFLGVCCVTSSESGRPEARAIFRGPGEG